LGVDAIAIDAKVEADRQILKDLLPSANRHPVPCAVVDQALEKVPVGAAVLGTDEGDAAIIWQFAAQTEACGIARYEQRPGRNRSIKSIVLHEHLGALPHAEE
jgi:hypothetical protein